MIRKIIISRIIKNTTIYKVKLLLDCIFLARKEENASFRKKSLFHFGFFVLGSIWLHGSEPLRCYTDSLIAEMFG